ncbi:MULTISPECIES: hypothetical protein [Flavobacterium]|uniref:hypothetical protein n=1 Tax=Flavobacterium TaxID=237 RepID=UPI001FCB1AA7|nr:MULTISPECIES: hypothetical protein [Flavobacterium]UOK42294.1 hypothetical protein LZF87_13385 [Flavobacterium enshiense]
MNTIHNTSSPLINKETASLKRKIFIAASFLLLITFIAVVLFFNKKEPSTVYGSYKIYSNDPMVNKFTSGEDIYLKVNNDRTIIYHTTINGKLKFHNTGVFTLDEKTNTLGIRWKEGKLPSKLKIEKQKENYVIKVGTTVYMKEKANS